MFVKPANPNAVIRDPHTKRPLPADGGRVPDNSYWRRRLDDGDVVLATATNEIKTAKPAKPAMAEVKTERTEPVGNEPTAPLITRGGK